MSSSSGRSPSQERSCIAQNISVALDGGNMLGVSRYTPTPSTPRTPSRLDRLIRERGMRRLGRPFSLEDMANGLSRQDDLSPFANDGERSSYFTEDGSDGLTADDGEMRPKQRLVVVANRLPVTATRIGQEEWNLEVSVGGLVSALLGVKEFETKWIGWPGVNVPDEVGQNSLKKAMAEKRCFPVFLDEDVLHQYYNGYCNNILWPLFHYLGLPQEDRLATTRSFQSQFDAYKKANQMFADVVIQHYEEDDIIWIHDYHLMFLPKYLKDYNNDIKVGWFLHTPFPSSEIHRTLPSRSELLRSVLSADLVGFHTYDYARHFVSACTRILGLEGTPEGVEDQGNLTRVAAFPIGIDADRFIRATELPQVQQLVQELKERFAGKKVMLGVDRLDMIKGIPQKVLAYEKFLEDNPRWHDKVVLLQIAVPTRTDVPEYQKLTSEVHEIVGRINGRFGTLTACPIHHLDRSMDFHALVALYAVTDVALITSLRDGMNLVSYEFVACQAEKKGVLILSEFAGAAQSLGAGALLVNPWNIMEVASSILQALEMPAEEREKRHNHNYNHVTTHTSQEWAETYVSELNDTILERQLRTKQVPPSLPIELTFDHYKKARNRLLILGFNATLTESVDNPERRGDQIREMEPKLHPDLKEPLQKLCDDPTTTVVILSGSTRSVLDDNFSEFDMFLAAENGMFLRSTSGTWMSTMPENLNMDWVDSVKHVFEYFTERTPRSHFELRETSIVWNYKYADIEFGRLQARDMLQHLWTGPISNAYLDVVQGSHSVEVRAVGVTKGAAIDRILGEIVHQKKMLEPIDYVLCVGHFLGKDEAIYTFFEPELPSDTTPPARSNTIDPSNALRMSPLSNGSSRTSRIKHHRQVATLEKKQGQHATLSSWQPTVYDKMLLHEGSSVLDLRGDNYFSCAVGRKMSQARYLLGSTDEVVTLMKQLAEPLELGESSS